MLTLLACISNFTVQLLKDLCLLTGEDSYEGLGTRSWGAKVGSAANRRAESLSVHQSLCRTSVASLVTLTLLQRSPANSELDSPGSCGTFLLTFCLLTPFGKTPRATASSGPTLCLLLRPASVCLSASSGLAPLTTRQIKYLGFSSTVSVLCVIGFAVSIP
jgi:hypothetical protein